MIKQGKACSQLMEANNTGEDQQKSGPKIFFDLHLFLML
jgi:hypothetical protein